MSSVTVITGIIVILAVLVCYAFVAQTIQNKRERRKRLLAALKSQSRNFKFILDGCPDGFLTKDLKLVVLRSLIEVSEKLSREEPKEPQFGNDLKHYTERLAEAQREEPNPQRVAIENPQQIKEAKMSLEELHRFIFNLEGQNRVTRNQGDAYRNQIKQLVLQITVDGYFISGQSAKQAGKTKLALHYFDLAFKLLAREDKYGLFKNKSQQLQSLTEELKAQLSEEEGEAALSSEELKAQSELTGEWDKFSGESDEDLWKKKQVYD